MKSLKTQFSELRKSTPKHVQWLLLSAAFIVVLTLLTLLVNGNKKQTVEAVESVQASITIDPDSVNWTETKIGETKSQRFTISASAPVKVDAVRLSKEIPGLSNPKTTCINAKQISDKFSCSISVEYAPKIESEAIGASLFIDWRGASQPENMKRTDKIIILVAAAEVEQPKTEPIKLKPEQVITPEPVKPAHPPIPVPAPVEDTEPTPAPVPIVAPKAQPTVNKPAEKCSDFAFPGYGMSGQQIGWIKPKSGSYMFHPFSDKDCTTPTGVYNPDNGIISDINNSGKKIGTDAEHIGHASITNGTLPKLSNPVAKRPANNTDLIGQTYGKALSLSEINPDFIPKDEKKLLPSSMNKQATVNNAPYDRTFVLRQYKPIPATIVSEIRAVKGETRLPVTATVDRNVYSDNGRTIIIPAGTMMLGSVFGDMPGPYKTIGRISIDWYRFVRPDGVEFNFTGGPSNRPFSGDAQGRTGVPGRGSTDYMEQFVMPMLTAIVPAAVNMIAPISDKFVNQIDLDNNTVTQSGQVRSSELAKNEIITAWNKVAQKLLVDMMDNTVPPFSIAAGTRITVFSPTDLVLTCGEKNGTNSKKCEIHGYSEEYAPTEERHITVGENPENASSLVGQVRSFNMDQYCDTATGKVKSGSEAEIQSAGYDYRTVVFYCQSNQYKAINNAKQEAVYTNQQQTGFAAQGAVSTTNNGTAEQQKKYNEQVLGLTYNEDNIIQNPFQKLPVETPPAGLTCEDGTTPDANGCCTGETYTDMGEQGFNCCPAAGGDCFPPLT
ncbi:MAG: hypothetical protein LBF28_00285 [Rickettsiales bacterium]|jgi:type IV secretory pathway VirB10-like protein|nr:hypothetical protein [Rickettsiales bacterium]